MSVLDRKFKAATRIAKKEVSNTWEGLKKGDQNKVIGVLTGSEPIKTAGSVLAGRGNKSSQSQPGAVGQSVIDPNGNMNPSAQVGGAQVPAEVGVAAANAQSNRPVYPTFSNVYDGADAGKYTLNAKLLNPDDFKVDTTAMDEMQRQALSTGDSPWARMALQKQGLEQNNLLNKSAKLSATSAAQNRANLASRGGLRGGAALRLANQAGQDSALSRQGVFQQGAMQRADIGMQDQSRKDSFLKALPGLQQNLAEFKRGTNQWNALAENEANRFNIQNRFGELNAGRTSEQNRYGNDMRTLAAEAMAEAIRNGGSGSGNWIMDVIQGRA